MVVCIALLLGLGCYSVAWVVNLLIVSPDLNFGVMSKR